MYKTYSQTCLNVINILVTMDKPRNEKDSANANELSVSLLIFQVAYRVKVCAMQYSNYLLKHKNV